LDGTVQTVKVGSKFRLTLPAEARRRLGIRPGDRLICEVRRNYVLLMREPESYAEQLEGLHAEIWAGVDPVEYVRRERGAWTR
jgi:AbrB family looped-hinge helix DNA binding protein